MPGPRVHLNPYMRIEAHSLRTSALELAYVSSGVQGQGGAVDRANKVVYFDMRLHEQGLTLVTVDHHSALYDLLMFPLVHEKGVGSYFYGNVQDEDYVKRSTSAKISLQFYVRAMMFQNKRLHYLAQEYALVQYSRMVEDTLAFQRSDQLQRYFKRRRDMPTGPRTRMRQQPRGPYDLSVLEYPRSSGFAPTLTTCAAFARAGVHAQLLRALEYMRSFGFFRTHAALDYMRSFGACWSTCAVLASFTSTPC